MGRVRPPLSARAQIIAWTAVACASLLVFVTALCMVLDPSLFNHPHWGLSYYGAQPITALPYYGGFLIVLFSLVRITQLLRPVRGTWRPLYWIFVVATVLSALVAATSYMQGALLYWSHIYICLALLLWVLGAEVWVLTRRGTSWQDYAAFGLLLTGVVLVNLSGSWIGVLGVYYWAEVVLFLGAFACLGRAAWRAVSPD